MYFAMPYYIIFIDKITLPADIISKYLDDALTVIKRNRIINHVFKYVNIPCNNYRVQGEDMSCLLLNVK